MTKVLHIPSGWVAVDPAELASLHGKIRELETALQLADVAIEDPIIHKMAFAAAVARDSGFSRVQVDPASIIHLVNRALNVKMAV